MIFIDYGGFFVGYLALIIWLSTALHDIIIVPCKAV